MKIQKRNDDDKINYLAKRIMTTRNNKIQRMRLMKNKDLVIEC